MHRLASWTLLLLVILLVLPLDRAAGAETAGKPSHAVSLRIRFGMKDNAGTDWSGKIAPSEGKVESIRGWRWMAGDSGEGDSFSVSTRRAQPQSAADRNRVKAGRPMPMTDNGIIVTLSGTGPA